MAAGNKRMIINTRERAVSDDINRLQQFRNQDSAEFFRYLIDVNQGTDDLDAAGVETQYASQESPLRAEIASGFLPQPQVGSTSCLVTPGVMYMLDPDTSQSPDDSSYKYIRDAGVTSVGVLTLTPNSSGSTRIDILECSRQAGKIVETDSRDIFDTSTGLFSPTAVTKVSADGLQYRIRTGTAGSGWPGTSQGWLPLAVFSVPTGTTNFDTVTIWDVRPLLADRAFNLTNTSLAVPRLNDGVINAVTTSATGGRVEAILNNRRVGGRLRRGSPGTDSTTALDLTAAANQDGFTFTANALYYLYLCCPFGLPRWARYTDATSGLRKPRSPRGIPVLSKTACTPQGAPTSPINLPAAFGFTSGVAQTSEAVCISASYTASPATQVSAFYLDNKKVINADTNNFQTLTQTVSANSASFTLVPGTDFPANAKSLILGFSAATGTAQASATIQLFYPSTATEACYISFVASGSLSNGLANTVELPIPAAYPATTQQNIKVYVSYATGGTVSGSQVLYVLGWSL